MRSTDIRSTFLDFFSARDHKIVPSSPLIPDDLTLLLTAAGMNQFKPYYLGESVPPHPRMTSVQKCVRTVDIDNVGRTTRHGTFFEMLGNFSFGDYFKDEVIAWSWELLTDHYGLDPDRLWVTVFRDDDGAERLWRRLGVPGDRIQRLGMADNYWSMGVPGPCGPSSELHYDRGPSFGRREGGPAVDGERYQEIWNLVFMHKRRGEGDGKDGFPVLGELPTRNIDTGLGMDRLAAILQDADTVCETDLLAPTFRLVQELAEREYPGRDGSEESTSFRVVAEHARSTAFLIADGVLPHGDGRGFVLRRLMRRAVRHARLLGVEGPVLPALTASVVDTLGTAWPELERRRDHIRRVVETEEDGFDRTLRMGSRFLDSAIGKARSNGTSQLTGQTVFNLHNSYGFPVDLTLDAARSAGLSVDEEGFGLLLEEHARRAKDAERDRKGDAVARQDTYRGIVAEHGLTDFTGYDSTEDEGRMLALLNGPDLVERAVEGEEVEVVLDRSPFYAEAGGQVGDTGTLRTPNGVLRIVDTRPGLTGLHVHTARVTSGEVRTGEPVEASVDADRRAATARSHSATHVLHAMLRRVLGEHAAQRGSRVEPGRLRFDFAHFGGVEAGALLTVQSLVNDYLMDDPDVRVWEAGRADAEAAGAIALFGEKYGEHVRIVDIGDASRELCGGTHVGHGSQAGPVHLVGESSIGVGLRRVEALTGADALRHYDHQQEILTELATLLEVRPDEAPGALRRRLDVLAETQRELIRLRRADQAAIGERLTSRSERVAGGWLIAERVDGVPPEDLRSLALTLTQREGAGVVILGTAGEGKATLVAAITRDLADTGLQARTLLANAGKAVGGGAGGRGPVAHAGGRDPDGLAKALSIASKEARSALTTPHP